MHVSERATGEVLWSPLKRRSARCRRLNPRPLGAPDVERPRCAAGSWLEPWVATPRAVSRWRGASRSKSNCEAISIDFYRFPSISHRFLIDLFIFVFSQAEELNFTVRHTFLELQESLARRWSRLRRTASESQIGQERLFRRFSSNLFKFISM